MSLKQQFHVGQKVFVKQHFYQGNKNAYRLVPVVLTKVGTKYLTAAEWWANKILPSSVYLREEDYAAEVTRNLANQQLNAQFNSWNRPKNYTTEQIRAACEILGLELAVFSDTTSSDR